MKNAVIYIHGKGGNVTEAVYYKKLFPNCEVVGFDYRAETPWEAKKEFTEYFGNIGKKYDNITVIANSIGAFFVMNADVGKKVAKAYFISPVADMEKLITDMMTRANVTEEELEQKKEITTAFGETLFREYLCYVRNTPLRWEIPTHIIYAENDSLTSFETISLFAEKVGATLDVMANGEHWFHTEEQMKFIDDVIKKYR